MKLTISLALGLSIMLPSLSTAQTKDDEGHVLVKLWSEYKKAHDNDRPKDEMAILRQIKDQASAQKLAWDFYDAGSKYASTGSRMNWKLRDSLDSAFGKELAGFSEPIAWFYHNSYNAIRRDYIETNKEKLTASRNSEFYKRDGRITRSVYSSVLVEQLKNDYEYAAWCILPGKELAGMFNDYPMHAFAEYKALGELPSGKEEATRAFVEKYKGRAAALLGEADLLQMRWNSLYRNEKSTSGQYEELAADCRDLNRRRDGFKGSEKAMVKNLKTADCLLEDMESKNVEADVTDGKLTVTLRNLESVTITLKKGSSKIYEKFLTNPVKSFYVEDKLLVQLPELADGNYTVTCRNGKTETEIAYGGDTG